ncbi:hypothetical protein A4G29_01375 [Mycobacterium kansasii]|nr:hypothetical protein A4G29_01375 [Mycobacterium kansasii]
MAKLRYQLTKVDGADPAILVEQAVVNVIVEQQKWLATTFPRLEPKYLFIGAKATSTGSARARTAPTHSCWPNSTICMA